MLNKTSRGVTFTFDEPSETPVYLAGDFNKWDPRSHPLRRGLDGRWSITISLPPGEHQFRYVKGGEWYNDHKADKYVPNALNAENSVVVVPAAEAVQPRPVTAFAGQAPRRRR